MSSLSTHILDQGSGMPAVDVEVLLQQLTDGGWVQIGAGRTNADGRITDFGVQGDLTTGIFSSILTPATTLRRRARPAFTRTSR